VVRQYGGKLPHDKLEPGNQEKPINLQDGPHFIMSILAIKENGKSLGKMSGSARGVLHALRAKSSHIIVKDSKIGGILLLDREIAVRTLT
jgi:hypothetical protein